MVLPHRPQTTQKLLSLDHQVHRSLSTIPPTGAQCWPPLLRPSRFLFLVALPLSISGLVSTGRLWTFRLFYKLILSKLANHAREIRMSEMDKIHEKRLLLDGEGIGEGRISNASLYSFKERIIDFLSKYFTKKSS